jgi:Ca2+-binding RTX toxin-like protein
MTVDVINLQRGIVQTITGTVAQIRDEDEFILRDRTGRIKVEADLDDDRALNLPRGAEVTVIGALDDDDFEALRITRDNGTVIFDRLRSRSAGRGNDSLTGSDRADQLNGGEGNDVLTGRGGRDRLVGGAGSDRFVYEKVSDRGDRILDFEPTQDIIDLAQLFAAPKYTSTQPLADYVKFVQSGANTIVQIDPNGGIAGDRFVTLITLQNTAIANISSNNFAV